MAKLMPKTLPEQREGTEIEIPIQQLQHVSDMCHHF